MLLLIIITLSCSDEESPGSEVIPHLLTSEPTQITDSSAVVGGKITETFGAGIVTKGVCYGLDPDPTREDERVDCDTTGTDFSCQITGLLSDTVYHVRAFATTAQGVTGYGNDIAFRTKIKETVCEVKTGIIQDTLFEKGFALTPLDPAIVQQGGGFEKTYVDTLDFGGEGSHPVWMLAQWYSKYDLADTPLKKDTDGSLVYANAGKKFALYPDHSLWMEVDAGNEYDSARVNGQPWPHLLIAQNFGAGSPKVGDADRLEFSMELKIEKCENKMAAGTYDPNIHTAQSPFYFILVNDNPNSDDYGQKIWFGLPSFDYRYQTLRDNEIVLWDIGTGMYIYDVPETKIWGHVSLHDGQWHTTRIDLIPLIERAVQAMREKGLFRNTVTGDLKITGMNFGWEVPGTFDAALRVRGISLISIKTTSCNGKGQGN